ncbi:MAG TPA: carbamoyltransferase N-terminal domain-containing protein, partial [Acidimicrobiales bacterium]|nr:carbamoyltransferase N-terminal domain-containing protein [Acidimicrobiales bacterium]
MIVLGIHDGHNASAALLRDGELVAAVQEERFTRLKNQGGMPTRAIDEVLDLGSVRRADLDAIAVADRYHYDQQWDRESVLRAFGSQGQTPSRIWAGHLPPVRAFRARSCLPRKARTGG